MRSKIIDNLKGPNAIKFKGIKCIKIATHKNSNIKNDEDYIILNKGVQFIWTITFRFIESF